MGVIGHGFHEHAGQYHALLPVLCGLNAERPLRVLASFPVRRFQRLIAIYAHPGTQAPDGAHIMLLESDGKNLPNPLMSGSRFDGISDLLT